MKVLAIGLQVSKFMCPLFRALHEKGGVTVDLFELRDKEHIGKCAYTSFNEVLDISLKIKDQSKSDIFRSVLSAYFVRKILSGVGVKVAVREAILYKRMSEVIARYDIIHICFVTKNLFVFFDALKHAKKIVVTMWGSDMHHNNSDFDYSDHAKLISIADLVTVHHREMKETFLSKFGRVYTDKVKEMLVVNGTEVLQPYVCSENVRQEHVNAFKKRYNIPLHKRVVAVGHSGHVIDNHIPIVQALAKVKDRMSEEICLVFPLTYNCESAQYPQEILSACDELGIQAVTLTAFLPYDELIESRIASEVVVRLSSYDAFSQSLAESLCCGSVVIVGGWLPYSKLTANRVFMKEVYDLDGLGASLCDVLDNYDKYNERSRANAEHVFHVFNNERSADKLKELYSQLN